MNVHHVISKSIFKTKLIALQGKLSNKLERHVFSHHANSPAAQEITEERARVKRLKTSGTAPQPPSSHPGKLYLIIIAL